MFSNKGMTDNSLINGGDGGIYSAIGNAGAGLINSVDNIDGKPSMGGSIATGALSGAAMGLSIAGPWGAAVGAVAGGAISFFTAKHKEKEKRLADQKIKEQQIKGQRRMDEMSSASNIANLPVLGVQSSGYYAKGGFVPPSYQVEDGEVLLTDDRMPPTVDQNGQVAQIAPNTFKFRGDKHSSPSGGIGVSGGKGFILSNKLKTLPSPYLKNI
ncbi:MAG TPA: hypothetical protein DCL77_08960 [Prolixibacteraceae bacterium]|nr:hypothetical protein [Prolixibacteraceae bacterium]